MSREDQQVRFLLCEPAKRIQSGSNVFLFHGECYKALAVFSSFNAFTEYKEHYSKITGKKLAKVLFHSAEKITSKHPHTFIEWIEDNQTTRKISQPPEEP